MDTFDVCLLPTAPIHHRLHPSRSTTIISFRTGSQPPPSHSIMPPKGKKKTPKLEPSSPVTKHPTKVTYPLRSLPIQQPITQLTGYVRATPPGHSIQPDTNYDAWLSYRSHPTRQYTHPIEGFDHILGEESIRQVDSIPIGGRIVSLDGPYTPELDVDEEEALKAELAQRRALLVQQGEEGIDVTDGREYGASRTPLDAPIGSLREKWRVLPHFLKLRGLMRKCIVM